MSSCRVRENPILAVNNPLRKVLENSLHPNPARRPRMSTVLKAFSILGTLLVHSLDARPLAPYTKVEESFNLHATHDALMYGVGPPTCTTQYDHFVFPGAVPRTFIGSVLLAGLSTPAIHLATWLGLLRTKFEIQVIVRLTLATLNALSLCLIRRAAGRRFGRITGLLFTVISVSQFHLPFWMGRTVPNMFALFPVNIATYLLIDRAPNALRPSPRNLDIAIALLTFPFFSHRLLFKNYIYVGLFSAVVSIALTVAVDSYFWSSESPLWPEFAGIWFNIVEGKSAEWGVSPFHTYITSFLPKILLGSLPLALLGAIVDPRIRSLLLPSAVFISLISNIGHKEWRFIVYIIPIFNIAAARGARCLTTYPKYTLCGRILLPAALGMFSANFLLTALSLHASTLNYPGGEAMALFHQLYPVSQHTTVHVHISNLAAQSGATLFTQLNAPPYPSYLPAPQSNWMYDKTEGLTPVQLTASQAITHLISEVAHTEEKSLARSWKEVMPVPAFERWAVDWELLKGTRRGDLLSRVWEVLRCVVEERLWILERGS
ncbi:Alg9-like mannosyltransferase family-domain-containing protein [Cyathus striatus]|nr:Alg9-like mannosyltransferase family-domain-containing protein [Cyathus striatus]